jgi:hypothetical protein
MTNLLVAAEIMGLSAQGDQIVQRLKKHRKELDGVRPYLKPPEVAEIRKAYRTIIAIAQDTAAHLNERDRFQVIANPEAAPSITDEGANHRHVVARTALAAAFLEALRRWALKHRDDDGTRVVIPSGVVTATELRQVVLALLMLKRGAQ